MSVSVLSGRRATPMTLWKRRKYLHSPSLNKIKETGLIPVHSNSGAIYFEQARLALECKMIYFHDITPNNFIDSDIQIFYPKKDYHRMYIGEIIKCLVK